MIWVTVWILTTVDKCALLLGISFFKSIYLYLIKKGQQYCYKYTHYSRYRMHRLQSNHSNLKLFILSFLLLNIRSSFFICLKNFLNFTKNPTAIKQTTKIYIASTIEYMSYCHRRYFSSICTYQVKQKLGMDLGLNFTKKYDR